MEIEFFTSKEGEKVDWKIIGVTDIIIVLFIIGALIFGIKKGFLEKFLSLASWIVALIISFIYCGRFASFLTDFDIFYPNIHDNVMQNIQSTEAFQNPNATAADFFKELGFPSIISNYIGDKIGIDAEGIALKLADEISSLFMVVIAFLCLFFGILILVFILKLFVKLIRQSTLVRVVDGILGFFLYGFLAICTIYVLFFALSLIMQIPQLEKFRDFMIVDMQLDNPNEFRLSKYFYENNILINFLKLFF